MWGTYNNESDSEDFSDNEIVDDEDKEDWSLTELKFMEFPKKEGKTSFDVGKCGKFCFEITFRSYGRLEMKLSLLSPCPMWIRNSSEVENGERKFHSMSDDESDDDDEACFKVARVQPLYRDDDDDAYDRLRGVVIDIFKDRPVVLYQESKPLRPETSKIKLYLRYRTPMSCVHPECRLDAVQLPLLSTLSASLEGLFLSGDSSDAVFQVGEVEFPVHKLILSNRYEYFKNLFASGTSRVVLDDDDDDTDADTVKEVLRLVYRGLPPNDFREKAAKYLRIADRYGMKDLKSICSDALIRHFNSVGVCEDVFETFLLAKLCDCWELKSTVVDHVKKASFEPSNLQSSKSESLFQKAIEHSAIAERDGDVELQQLSSTVFGKMLDKKNIFRALELSQHHQCPKLVNEVVQYADKGFRGQYDREKVFAEAAKRLPIAHRDANEDLKKVCSGVLKCLISTKYFCKIILLAHQNDCPSLKKVCLRKLDEFKELPDFKDKTADEAFQLLEKDPILKAEVKAIWDAIQLLQATRK